MSTSNFLRTSVMAISLSIILVCMGLRSSWKKYTNRCFPPHEEIKSDFSLEPPSMDVDEDQRSILASRKKYAVFISFRGEDTRNSFTSHLYEALTKGGIETFIDDGKLERGQEISKALFGAINDSTFSVVIFSENYAASSWCLDELEHIIQCMQQKKTQIVLPVFYHVDPSDVRRQKGTYADAFAEHEQRYNDSMIRKWKAALTTAANLSGWHLSKLKNEAELVREIVNHIRGKLRSTSSTCYLKEGLVGIEKSVTDLKTLLSNSPMVGIYGLGGLGKTTLADAVFKQLRSNFDNYCFLRNFREQLEKHGSTYVVEDFFKKLSREENIDVEDLDSVKERLRHKKLLIVLDDLDDTSEECHSLLIKDYRAWLNSESKVIITSRDKQVLRNIIGDDAWLYSLRTLNREKALKLFYLHAFKSEAVDQNYKELSKKFVDYAQGLPLALKVLGSQLFGKDKNVWQSMLSKLKEVHPDQGIVKVLRISFDGLEEIQKNIFLDIACFFRDWDYERVVKKMLDACYGSSFDVAIEVLVDKCLITKYYDDKEDIIVFEMHDLLEEMGQSIACESDDRCLENYSRLWRPEDICHVLKNNIGTSKIKGIYFDGYGIQVQGEINLDPSVFKKMSSLKLLQLSPGHDDFYEINPFQLPHGLDSFPIELRYLQWNDCPLKSLGSKFTLPNLVHLRMRNSQLEKLWDGIQDLKTLKYVDLSGSKKLTCLPNLSRANLCHMDLHGCESLVELPPLRFHNVHDGKLNLSRCCNLRIVSEMFGNIKFIDLSWMAIEEVYSSIGSLKNLHKLNLSYCEHLKKLPSSICYFESLEFLGMHGCVSIDKFPELPKNIKELDLSQTSIQQINSSSFECMPFLESLDMRSCTMLKSLPTTISKLKSLEKLYFSDCSQLKSFPEISEPMENLRELYLDGTLIDAVPQSICKFKSLEKLSFKNCSQLKSFPEISEPMENLKELYLDGTLIDEVPRSICKLKSLEKLSFSHCSQLKSFPEISEPMENLKELYLDKTLIDEVPRSICKLKSLEKLSFRHCSQLKSFPEISEPMENLKELYLDKTLIDEVPRSICKLKSLEKLSFRHCSQLKSFPEISEPMENLKELYLDKTLIDEVPRSICKLKSLEKLSFRHCSQVKSFPEISEPMENLKELYLDGTLIDEVPRSICKLKSLELLSFRNCSHLKSFPEISEPMENLKELYLDETLIDEVPRSICKLKSLELLSFRNCSHLKSFPEISEPMENLKELYLNGTLIEEVPQSIKYLPKLTTLNLSGCENLKSIPVSNIYNMPNISRVYIDEYQIDQDWPVLSDVWISETLQQSKCRCSCSNTNLISILQWFFLFRFYIFWKDFTCCECFLLYTIHNILMEATIFKIINPVWKEALYGPRVIFCYPGNKIPQWFAYKSMGFELHVDSAPSTWIGDESCLGIVICLVVDLRNFNDLPITCEIHCLTSLDKSHVFHSCLEITQKHTQCDTDRVFILYLTRKDIYSKLYDAKNASFEFNIMDSCGATRIKECGIRFIYKEDAEEFGTIHPETRNAKRTKI